VNETFNFEEYRKIELRIRELSKKKEFIEKERDELKRRRKIQALFSNYI